MSDNALIEGLRVEIGGHIQQRIAYAEKDRFRWMAMTPEEFADLVDNHKGRPPHSRESEVEYYSKLVEGLYKRADDITAVLAAFDEREADKARIAELDAQLATKRDNLNHALHVASGAYIARHREAYQDGPTEAESDQELCDLLRGYGTVSDDTMSIARHLRGTT